MQLDVEPTARTGGEPESGEILRKIQRLEREIN